MPSSRPPPPTHPFIRYALTGAVATGLHYALLLTLVELLGWPAPGAAMLGALAGALLAYAGNKHFTFDAAGVAHVQALPRFALVALAGVLLNGAIVWLFSSRLGLHYLAAQVLATVLTMILTYRLNRTWSFA
ncbi:MAG: GtrA family protein [Burkholderiaceae bacterium]